MMSKLNEAGFPQEIDCGRFVFERIIKLGKKTSMCLYKEKGAGGDQ
jgi:hypothetical protein